jgi:hypothetical protein
MNYKEKITFIEGEMNIERDKFLTEAMGECWHEWVETNDEWGELYCSKCNTMMSDCLKFVDTFHKYSEWDGFGKLITWVRQQEWYERFHVETNGSIESWRNYLIDPDELACAVYVYLKVNK